MTTIRRLRLWLALPMQTRGLLVAMEIALMLTGLALIVLGVAQWSRGAAYIVAGVLLVLIRLLPTGRRS